MVETFSLWCTILGTYVIMLNMLCASLLLEKEKKKPCNEG